MYEMMVQLAAHMRIFYDRWGVGLSVMLEKLAGVILINKLREILLMEEDFNFMNKLIFGTRMLAITRSSDLIPVEAFGGTHNKTAE